MKTPTERRSNRFFELKWMLIRKGRRPLTLNYDMFRIKELVEEITIQ